jgi:hypothetical protein
MSFWLALVRFLIATVELAMDILLRVRRGLSPAGSSAAAQAPSFHTSATGIDCTGARGLQFLSDLYAGSLCSRSRSASYLLPSTFGFADPASAESQERDYYMIAEIPCKLLCVHPFSFCFGRVSCFTADCLRDAPGIPVVVMCAN